MGGNKASMCFTRVLLWSVPRAPAGPYCIQGSSCDGEVNTTNPKKYCVRPNTRVAMPHSTYYVVVTMQAQKEAPPDVQCRDKSLLHSIVFNLELQQSILRLKCSTR